ncbi:MAG: hypothetical protein KF878_00120 [Planctomycetes bacterium]|nr:hypothetical protein [Planctomycetota bacterium]
MSPLARRFAVPLLVAFLACAWTYQALGGFGPAQGSRGGGGPPAAPPSLPRHQHGYSAPQAATNAVYGYGLLGAGTVTQSSATRITDDKGTGQVGRTAASSGGVAGVVWSSMARLDTLPHVLIRFAIEQTTSVRAFVGLASNGTSGPSSVASSAVFNTTDELVPTRNVGLYFSAALEHTNWHWIEDAGTAAFVDTGVAPAANKVYFLEIQVLSATSIVLTLRDEDFVSLATRTVTASLASTDVFSLVLGVEATSASARGVVFYGASLSLENTRP